MFADVRLKSTSPSIPSSVASSILQVGVFYKGDVYSVTNTLQENLARLQEDNMRMHMENRLAQEENRRIYEEHRLAQEDMKANLLQMKDLLAGFLSSKPTGKYRFEDCISIIPDHFLVSMFHGLVTIKKPLWHLWTFALPRLCILHLHLN